MAKKTCSGKRKSCHVLISTLGQLPCKKKELPSAYVHARAVAMYHAKTDGNLGKRELPSAYKQS